MGFLVLCRQRDAWNVNFSLIFAVGINGRLFVDGPQGVVGDAPRRISAVAQSALASKMRSKVMCANHVLDKSERKSISVLQTLVNIKMKMSEFFYLGFLMSWCLSISQGGQKVRCLHVCAGQFIREDDHDDLARMWLAHVRMEKGVKKYESLARAVHRAKKRSLSLHGKEKKAVEFMKKYHRLNRDIINLQVRAFHEGWSYLGAVDPRSLPRKLNPFYKVRKDAILRE